jgi:hypothetical protein
VYNNDGRFFLRTFGSKTRTEKEILNDEVDINEILKIDSYTMCNKDFSDPFATVCMISHVLVFVSVFYNHSRTHYHFMYDVASKQV